MLSVLRERKLPDDATEENGGYRRERFGGPFKRVITLPESLDTESTEAVYKNRVLHSQLNWGDFLFLVL